MNKQILAFGASSSKYSINKQFAKYVADLIPNASVNLLDLNDFEMPIYSIDREKEQGIPELAHLFREHISASDALVISFAEHNGSYTAAFKNIYDWISRVDRNVWQNKPMFLLSTAPGARGGKTVLAAAESRYQRSNTNQIITFSLPHFKEHFSSESGITDPELKHIFDETLSNFIEAINEYSFSKNQE